MVAVQQTRGLVLLMAQGAHQGVHVVAVYVAWAVRGGEDDPCHLTAQSRAQTEPPDGRPGAWDRVNVPKIRSSLLFLLVSVRLGHDELEHKQSLTFSGTGSTNGRCSRCWLVQTQQAVAVCDVQTAKTASVWLLLSAVAGRNDSNAGTLQ